MDGPVVGLANEVGVAVGLAVATGAGGTVGDVRLPPHAMASRAIAAMTTTSAVRDERCGDMP